MYLRTGISVLVSVIVGIAMPPVSNAQQEFKNTPSSEDTIFVTFFVIDSSSRSETPPSDFVSVDKEAVVLKRQLPEYPADITTRVPELHRVWVKAWIGKNGLVRQVGTRKRDPDALVQGIVQALQYWKFQPATIAGKPVEVWVSIPFKYTP